MRTRIVCSVLATCMALQGCIFGSANGAYTPLEHPITARPGVVAMPAEGLWPAAPLSTLQFAVATIEGAPGEAIALPASGVRIVGAAAGTVTTVLRIRITLAHPVVATAGATMGPTLWTVAQGAMDLGSRTVALDGGTIELQRAPTGEWTCGRVELRVYDPNAPAVDPNAAVATNAQGSQPRFGDFQTAGFVTGPGHANTNANVNVNVNVNVAHNEPAPAVVAGGQAPAIAIAGGGGAGAPPAAGVSVNVNVRVQAGVRRVSLGGGSVLSDGAIAITGAGLPPGETLTILDGAFDVEPEPLDASAQGTVANAPRPAVAGGAQGAAVAPAAGGTARVGATVTMTMNGVRRVRGGTVVLASRGGHRWRARITGGRVRMHQTGFESDQRHAYAADEGALEVAVTADLGTGFAPPELPSADVGIAVPNVLSVRANHALDELVALAPADSRDKKRLEAAVRYVRFTAESPQSDFYSVRVEGHRVVLLVDVSYSMSATDPAARAFAVDYRYPATRLDVARAQLVKLIASVEPGVLVDIVAFSSAMQTMWPAPRVVDDAALDNAVHWVYGLAPRDETEPEIALRAAVAMNADRVLLLSDGRPTYRAHEPAVVSLVSEMHAHGTRVDAVSVGNDGDVVPFLAQLATAGGGTLALR